MDTERAKSHAKPIEAVVCYMPSQVGWTGGASLIALMLPSSGPGDSPLAVHPVNHN